VAVASDGSVYIATATSLRRVDSDGVISTVVQPFELTELAAAPFGLVAAAGLETESEQDIVASVDSDGMLERLAGGGPESAFDGDGESPLSFGGAALDVSPAADGGLLFSTLGSVRYLPPEHPQKLAIAITRPTLTSPPRLRVSFATTMPARVTLSVSGNGVKTAPIHASVPSGDSTLELGRRLKPDTYTVHLTASRADGQMASDQQVVFPGGGVLTTRAARRLAASEVKRVRAVIVPPPPAHLGECRRFGPRRVDCRVLLRGHRCWEIASIRLHSDGLPYLRTYAMNGGCRFRRQPRGHDEPAMSP
jgi:hypothetical protein